MKGFTGRIDPYGPSEEKTNWHSAASTADMEPYLKLQYKQSAPITAAIEIIPKVFSPDTMALMIYNIIPGNRARFVPISRF